MVKITETQQNCRIIAVILSLIRDRSQVSIHFLPKKRSKVTKSTLKGWAIESKSDITIFLTKYLDIDIAAIF